MSVCKTSAQIDSLAIKEKKARKINCQKIQNQISFFKSIFSTLGQISNFNEWQNVNKSRIAKLLSANTSLK